LLDSLLSPALVRLIQENRVLPDRAFLQPACYRLKNTAIQPVSVERLEQRIPTWGAVNRLELN
jgi:hypothetical protein